MKPRSVLLAVAVLLVLACPSGPEPEPEPETPAPLINELDTEGPFGLNPLDVIEPWDIELEDGTGFDLEDRWTGDDSYVFIQRTSSSYSNAYWNSDLAQMLEVSARNVHYFFIGAREFAVDDDLGTIRASINAALSGLDSDDRDHWEAHLHVARDWRGEVNGPIEAVLEEDWSRWGFAIDRFQQLREVGLLQYLCDGCTGEMLFFGYLGDQFNYEYNRDVHLAENPADVEIELWDTFQMEGDRAELIIDLPENIEQYDTLEVDLTMGCTDSLDGNCFEWDYRAWMMICEMETEDPAVPESCQPQETDAEGNVTIEAETLACECTSSYAEPTERVRTCQNVTDEEGNVIGGAFSACPCGCDHPIARWITPYHRHGRWVTDISPMLAHMQNGPKAKIKIDLDYPFVVSSTLRFTDRGDELKPLSALRLWGGGGFGAGYNDAHEPILFIPPTGAVAAKIHATITGHGFGGDAANCAEFCPHEHFFSLNSGEWQSREFNEARNRLEGCAEQIIDGAIPNQFGTWYLGRGGWCPGMDVPPVIFDVSEDLIPGAENTVRYRASLNNNDPNNHGSIWMDSYLVFYR
jgi:hypothetical protein